MPVERIISGKALSEEEEHFNRSLRPRTLDEYIGQRAMVDKLRISVQAARNRSEPIEHVLLHGPPGLGKTTLAHIIAHEMGARMVQSSGPALVRPGDLMGILTNLERGDVLFIDEVHRLAAAVEEFLYPAMEDFQVDFVLDKGMYAKTINVPLKQFTLVGATTRAGLLTAPLRERFGIFHHLDFYPAEELQEIIRRSARMLEVEIESQAVVELARRSRGTPRTANRLLRRVRDYAQVKAAGQITAAVADEALLVEGVDQAGLDELDRKVLHTIIDFYHGGPVGIEAIAATLNEEVDTLVDMVEPFLLKTGFISRTSKGRRASKRAYDHLGLAPPRGGQGMF
ncbi:MAG: Holliday junction DNA helicase RuvB [Deltaproteobacteria bacterium RBG_13_61_14]|nr:MAG: Holliday junction DNA helicase RuvB [Deltaproteobacteria bacterium RBG_13_61_14]